MDQNWESDYTKYKADFETFQDEVELFINGLIEKNIGKIDISNIYKRNGIKSEESIRLNYDAGRYKKLPNLLAISDISGVRVTCHCEDDVENLSILLEWELRQIYGNVSLKQIWGKYSEYPYRATHLTFTKNIQNDKKTYQISSEIQIRTIMADAWAVQNHKYLYKKWSEGESHELTSAVSEIMNWCEKLWSLVKKKGLNSSEDQSKEFDIINRKAESSLSTITNTNFTSWFQSNKETSSIELKKLGVGTFMEVEIQPLTQEINISRKDLKEISKGSQIHTFGWPIAVHLENRDEFAPKPDADWIHAEVSINEEWSDWSKWRITYDYWAIHSGGAFYLKKNIFEDSRRPNEIFFDTRIVRTTEVFMYIKNLYSGFKIPVNSQIQVTIRYGGLKWRTLSAESSNRSLFSENKIETDEVSTTILTTLEEIESNMANVVEKFTKPLFEQFEFFELGRPVLENIVLNYINGKVV